MKLSTCVLDTDIVRAAAALGKTQMEMRSGKEYSKEGEEKSVCIFQ